MTERLQIIFSNLPSCEVFADIGCDHGYVAEAMVSTGKCKKFIISDISAKCLKKAQDLLASYIENGKGQAVVSNGFERVNYCDLALIAGMGGEEIVGILRRAKRLPTTLCLQPMKNCDKVRRSLNQLGYMIEKDFVFFSAGKYYDLILAVKGKQVLTDEEIEFGKTNLLDRPSAFLQRNANRIEKLKKYLKNPSLSEENKKSMTEEIERLNNYV